MSVIRLGSLLKQTNRTFLLYFFYLSSFNLSPQYLFSFEVAQELIRIRKFRIIIITEIKGVAFILYNVTSL